MAGERTFSLRRWFQFSLTSLLLLTTLVALWLAWELAFIRERQAWLRENAALVPAGDNYGLALLSSSTLFGTGSISVQPTAPPTKPSSPWWRRMLGDEAVPTIFEGDNWTDDDRATVARLFPESLLLPALPEIPIRLISVETIDAATSGEHSQGDQQTDESETPE